MKQRGLNHVMKYHRDRIQYHHSAATSTINNNVDLKFFYGAAGRGTGSRIKGFLRRSHIDVIATIEQQSKVFITDEYRTTKLCCLCHHVVNHPRKQSGKLNLGTVICVNPECIGKKFGCIARSRDANASMNMIMSGLQQELYGSMPSPFHRSFSSS
ncbi:uncharacterized protein BX664DRAFT_326896 [Halteromyces radiatus]|uniref:uncharacterized protein n=1 Tax=Halteromyces radiatus TaxID=101107 RepID=UPI00222115DC|nr:uncharacterized protein BX664DRAFT_326896 [Halteromyces radiatus]KAI8097644.1 hypothetical protein BX664DRAFT_326896 [Halteromyces radiatus]